MEDYTVQLDCNHLLSILGTNLDLPYRHQRHLKLVVPYEEYVQFVKSMVDNSLHWLSFSRDMYRNALDSKDLHLLLRLYYLDISRAQASELRLSILSNTESTNIAHSFSTEVKELNQSDIGKCISEFSKDDISKASKSLLKDLALNDLSCVSKHNSEVLDYTLYLRLLSFQQEPKMLNVV